MSHARKRLTDKQTKDTDDYQGTEQHGRNAISVLIGRNFRDVDDIEISTTAPSLSVVENKKPVVGVRG